MSNVPQQPPILDRLRQLLEDGKKLISKADLHGIGVEAWVMRLRSVLQKIYGEKATELDYFPPPGRDPPGLSPQVRVAQRLTKVENLIRGLQDLPQATTLSPTDETIFIGHGRSLVWLSLRDFIVNRLGLACEEFNAEPTPGIHTTERLQTMLSKASVAFLVLTAEEKHQDGTLHARPNVIHEVGLFQGRLGPRRAIVMIEENCTEFSNLAGLTTIRFPTGDIAARFEDVRRVLEREGRLRT